MISTTGVYKCSPQSVLPYPDVALVSGVLLSVLQAHKFLASSLPLYSHLVYCVWIQYSVAGL